MPTPFGRRLPPTVLIGTPQRLAVDGDDAGIEPGQARDPGDEARLELFGVEDRENVAELIVRRGLVLEWPEATQQRQLLLAVSGDLDPAFAAGDHAEQHQQEHLVKRIEHLAALARVI